jgi:hypothetical protein
LKDLSQDYSLLKDLGDEKDFSRIKATLKMFLGEVHDETRHVKQQIQIANEIELF